MPDGVCSVLSPAVADAALRGLTAARKTLPPKLFYDAEGCRLFDLITALPEYYVTRTEVAVLRDIAGAVAELVAEPDATLVEYGASREDKAAILMGAFAAAGRPIRTYVPIDVAETALSAVVARMAVSHPRVEVLPLAADFLDALTLPPTVRPGARVGFFPGSTIGNLEPAAAGQFLAQARQTLGAAARLLVGVDLRKDPAVVIPAYDDAAGVTAAFNRNLLVRLNREAGADFDINAFSHRAIWNDAQSRIEMHLVSDHAQTVRLAGHDIAFAAGETIHTENSYKHSLDDFAAIASGSLWQTRRVWTDKARLFSVHLLEVK